MINSVHLKDVQYIEGWAESDQRLRWSGAFPFPEGALEDLSVVHFCIEPGSALPRHTDSREELIILLSGTVKATVGDESAVIHGPSLTRIPAMAPHDFSNIGEETAVVVGVFGGRYAIATFEEVLYPFGMQVLRVPPPAVLDAAQDAAPATAGSAD
jgi:quercetin dioxygenase-like cupin family protein